MTLRFCQNLRLPLVPPSNFAIKSTRTRRLSVHNSLLDSNDSRKVLLLYPLFFYYLFMLSKFLLPTLAFSTVNVTEKCLSQYPRLELLYV